MTSTEADIKRKTENERISKIPAENPQNPTGSHYEVLGVKPDATSDEINKAYKDLALLVHPDKNPDDPNAQENFQKIKTARDLLIDDEKRKRYDDALKAAMPKSPETIPEAPPKEEKEKAGQTNAESNTDIQKSSFKWAIRKEDDPMTELLKEWYNMMVDLYGGDLEGAAWDQVKSAFKAVKNYLSEQVSPDEQQTQANSNIPKPKPVSLTDEQIEAYKSLGLNTNKPVDPQVVDVASNLKINEIDRKINDCNDRMKALSDKMTADYDKLSENLSNQQPPMNHEEYQEKHTAIYDQYLKDYNALPKEFNGLASQRADCLNARDVLLQTPSLQNDIVLPPRDDSEQAPPMISANDTMGADKEEEWAMDDLFYPERKEEAKKEHEPNMEFDNDAPQLQ